MKQRAGFSRGCSKHQEPGRVREGFPPNISERARLCCHLDFLLLASTLRGNKFLLFLAIQSVVHRYSSRSKLQQHIKALNRVVRRSST